MALARKSLDWAFEENVILSDNDMTFLTNEEEEEVDDMTFSDNLSKHGPGAILLFYYRK